MTVQEIGETHKILVENLDLIAPDENDHLRQIFNLLNYEPDLESFTINYSNNRQSTASVISKNDSMHEKSFSKNTQLCLTLTNRFTPNTDEKADLNNLFTRFYF
jgi:hypothetical protein